ncbi:MAG: hypothetical protein K2P95_08065, partial [Hyphomonadaceae bacterium]|nr:hypothetical protein [Hyphomonadaceae bacterium]
MSDVAILFAREDEAKARSLRAALADSGLAVALAPVETLTPPLASPVIVALWSRALASSRPAIRVAEQAIRVGRLVSGRLDVNTPNGLFHGHAMQDLSRWGGDPNDPALDGLIAAADRTVLAARAAAEVFEELDPVEDMLAAAPEAAAREEF